MLCKCGCGEILGNPNSKTQTNKGHHHRLEETKKKKKMSCIKKFGVENPSQSYEIKEKKKRTCLENYGTENPNQSLLIQARSKKTCFKKYGTDSYSKTEEYQKKYKQTCMDRYGVENVFQNEEIKNRIYNYYQKRYGVRSTNKLEWVKKKQRQTCLKRYGVDNYAKTDRGRLISRESLLRDLSKKLLHIGRIGKLEPSCFEKLQKYTIYKIQRIKLFGFLPDGYISELKLVIEFDEPYHESHQQKIKDQKKDTYLNSKNIHVFRIKQKDWLLNEKNIILQFKTIIEEKIKNV